MVKFTELARDENNEWSVTKDAMTYTERILSSEQLDMGSIRGFFGGNELYISTDSDGKTVVTERVLREYIKDVMRDFSLQNFRDLYLAEYNYCQTPPTLQLFVKGTMTKAIDSAPPALKTSGETVDESGKEKVKAEKIKKTAEQASVEREIRAIRLDLINKYWGRNTTTGGYVGERVGKAKEEAGAEEYPFLYGMYETVGRLQQAKRERGVFETPAEVYKECTT